MIKHMLVAAGLLTGACKKDKPAATSDNAAGSSVAGSAAGSSTGSAAGSAAGSGAAAGSAAGSDAGSGAGSFAGSAAVTIPTPPPTTLAGTEPPTAESVHVEIAYALARWHATPRDKAIYAADFGGRDIADGREPLVPYDKWLEKLPPTPAFIQNASVSSWLENKDRGENETRVNVSYFYGAGKDQYRELTFKREGGKQVLVKESVNSENHRDTPYVSRNWLPVDAEKLGKKVTARFGMEGDLAWALVTNDKGEQVVADLWPEGPCEAVEPPKGAIAMLRCKNSGEGHDFTMIADKDALKIKRSPAGKDAPSGTDHEFRLAKGAKVTLDVKMAGAGPQ